MQNDRDSVPEQFSQRNSRVEAKEGRLRDFFYLDIDRTRSLLAQLKEGVPEAVETSAMNRGAGGVKFGLNIDYAYEKGESETRSLHHHLYSLLEDGMVRSGRLLAVSEEVTSMDEWNSEGIPDSAVVLAEGHIRLLDFPRIADVMEYMPRVYDLAQLFERSALKKRFHSGDLTQREYDAAVKGQSEFGIDRKELKGIVDAIRNLYGDALRLKLLPFRESPAHYLVGDINPAHLQQPRSNLWLTGGVESSSRWYAMGVVNHTVRATVTGAVGTANLEDSIEQIMLSYADVASVTVRTELPAITFTPIAVYRVV